MGNTVQYTVYDLDTLVDGIISAGKTRNEDTCTKGFIVKALLGFGDIFPNNIYVSLWDEWADDYNSNIQCMNFFERFFGIEDMYEVMEKSEIQGESTYEQHNNADNMAGELEVELPEEGEDEEAE